MSHAVEKNSQLYRLRHSLAHIMAQAVQQVRPGAKLGFGPPVDNGFYYDFILPEPLSEEDFPKIEKQMRKIIGQKQEFQLEELPGPDAIKRLEGMQEPHKIEYAQELLAKRGLASLTFYTNGPFVDMCEGPHVATTTEIPPDCFKLDSVAGAYWRGDERNVMMTRLYALAFETKEALQDYLRRRELAKERDHRKLGRELEIYILDEAIGKGLPLWQPNGAVLCHELERLAYEMEFKDGYVRVATPHITKKDLYEATGHLPYYKEAMFPPMEIREASVKVPLKGTPDFSQLPTELARKVKFLKNKLAFDGKMEKEERDAISSTVIDPTDLKAIKRLYEMSQDPENAENSLQIGEEVGYSRETYYLKPMNCPHHHRIYASRPRSYRELPLRLAEYGTVYRFEMSGALQGLTRVRGMHMNDAHIYCTPEQIRAEFVRVMQLHQRYYDLFGFSDYYMRVSLWDPSDPKGHQKYVNDPLNWALTEKLVQEVMIDLGLPHTVVKGEAAFYGPKVDIQFHTVIGREFTVSTNQVDFAVPKRLNLSYIDRNGEEGEPLCIHRAPLGTHERFIAFLIEHYGGAFPTWLAPVQVRILPVSEKYLEYANKLNAVLRDGLIRAEVDESDEKLGKKIRLGTIQKIPILLVVGEKETADNTVTVRRYKIERQATLPFDAFLAGVREEIATRRHVRE